MELQRGTGEGARSLVEAFASVPDPRSAHGRRHPLGAMLTLAVCGMLCGARSLYAIAQWGRDHGSTVAKPLGFTRATTPCVATLHLVFRRLNRAAFEAQLWAWFQEQGLKWDEALAVNGKALRGIHGEELPGVHLVAAYAHQTGIAVGQQAAEGKAQELTAILDLLEQTPLKDRVLTGDALFDGRELSRQIVAKWDTISG